MYTDFLILSVGALISCFAYKIGESLSPICKREVAESPIVSWYFSIIHQWFVFPALLLLCIVYDER
eukprot:Pgem_evm1s9735